MALHAGFAVHKLWHSSRVLLRRMGPMLLLSTQPGVMWYQHTAPLGPGRATLNLASGCCNGHPRASTSSVEAAAFAAALAAASSAALASASALALAAASSAALAAASSA